MEHIGYWENNWGVDELKTSTMWTGSQSEETRTLIVKYSSVQDIGFQLKKAKSKNSSIYARKLIQWNKISFNSPTLNFEKSTPIFMTTSLRRSLVLISAPDLWTVRTRKWAIDDYTQPLHPKSEIKVII